MNNNSYGALVIGASIAAIVTVLVTNFFNRSNVGGGKPRQGRYRSYTARTPGGRVVIETPSRLSGTSSPVAQNTPITEASYNVQPTKYAPTLGPEENGVQSPLTLPA